MKKQVIILVAVVVNFCSAIIVAAATLPQAELRLVIYNNNFAVVRQRREFTFQDGLNSLKLTDIASAIDPTSVTFQSLSAPAAVSVIEQNYEYDLINTTNLLKRYIDKNIRLTIKGSGADVARELIGTLSALTQEDLILHTKSSGIEVIDRASVETISLKELPAGLVTKPTLIWLINAKKSGKQLCAVTYTTEQINWTADYSALLDADESRIDLSCWVSIDNKSGADYKDAAIKLIAGDVRRVTEPIRPLRGRGAMKMAEAMEAGFREKPFAEYHVYTLGRESTIKNNQLKQIELMASATGVPVKKLYIYDRQQSRDKVQTKFEFRNTEKNRLGIALPKGKVRLFKKDLTDGMLEFLGEDMIDHTAKGEKLSLYMGDAFDVTAEYTLVDSKRARRMRSEKHKIELRNSKQKAITVFVDEKFPAHVNWQIDESTHKHKKHDARTARFEVPLKADSTVVIQYAATQTW